MGRLDEKVCIVTGAGSGMGRAMAQLFHAEGARLVLADISGNEAEVAAELSPNAVAVHCDVADEGQVQSMVAAAKRHFGRLDVLCNNAGFGGPMAPLHTQTLETWDRVHATNLRGAFLCMKHAIASMLRNDVDGRSGRGSIVNTTSASAVVGWKHHGVYGAAKAGLNQLTRVAALDYADQGIRVNAVAPGTIWTGLVEASRTHETPPADFPKLAGIPMDRWGLAEDIARAALFLASDEAAYVTGVVLPVDGGYTIGFSGMGAERPGLVSAPQA